MTVGRIVLNRNPENYLAEVEQAAFNPAHFGPGIGPSPDKMLQGRLFSYGDTHRYRLGANHVHLPLNQRHGAEARNYSRDMAMRVDGNYGRQKNYEPNSFGGPVQSDQPLWSAIEVHGLTGNHEPEHHRADDDFVRAGDLYPPHERSREGASGEQYRRESVAGQQERDHRRITGKLPQSLR